MARKNQQVDRANCPVGIAPRAPLQRGEFRAPFDAIRDTTHRAIMQFIEALALADASSSEPILREFEPETASFVILNAVQWNATQTDLYGAPHGVDAVVEVTADMISRYLFRD